MTTIVQSRFAGLRVEDDDFPTSSQINKKTKPASAPAKKPDVQKKTKKATQASSAGKKKGKKSAATDAQWEQWKQKDEEMVNGTYEAELTQAILLSKLEFEAQRDVFKHIKKQSDADKRLAEQAATAKEQNKAQKKQKKKNVMSLEQFNDMVGGEDNKRLEELPQETEEPSHVPADTRFFDRVDDEAQKELRRDKYKESVLQRQPQTDEIINRVQFAEALAVKDREILRLNEEVSRLKEELLTVKTRNKKLCNILGQGEMRDKAEALVELEKLRQVQTELTAEVASLHERLEQERSRHDTKTKDKKKKEK